MRQLQLVERFEDIKKDDRLVLMACPWCGASPECVVLAFDTGLGRLHSGRITCDPAAIVTHDCGGCGYHGITYRAVAQRRVFRIIDVTSADSSDVTGVPVSRKLERAL